MRTKHAIGAVVVLASALASQATLSQNYPAKPVHIVVPYTAGGLFDILARGIAQEVTKVWGHPVIVDNRPGAGTRIGAEFVARSAPDGHTLLLADASVYYAQYLYSKMAYDPVRDFAPVLNLAQAVPVLVAGPGIQATTLQEFVALAKARPGEVTYGTYGIASTAHLMTEQFAELAGIKLNHIPFKGIADVLPAVISGQIAVALSATPPAIPLIRSAKVKAFGYAGSQRAKLLPTVPTFHEAGLSFETHGWIGLLTQAATPRPMINKAALDISRIVGTAQFNEKYIEGASLELLNMGPDAYAEFLKKDRAVWAALVTRVNVKLD